MRFVTLFPRADATHLRKDPGMVGASLAKAYGWECTLACFEHGPMNPPQGLKVEFIPGTGYKSRRPDRRVFRWLQSNAGRIDVLHLFHFNLESTLYGLWYKRCNPKGKLYLKLDMDPREFTRDYLRGYPGLNPWARFDSMLRRRFLARCSLVTADTRVAETAFRSFAPELDQRLRYMPNGVDAEFVAGVVSVTAAEVEHQVLVVGRHGSYQKNTELILAALRLLQPNGWKVVFVGTMENDIEKAIAKLEEEFHGWKGKLEQRGVVTDRTLLGRLFAQSAVFCLPSRSESFGLVLAEALAAGCACVATDIPTSRELVSEPWQGSVCGHDAQALALAIDHWRKDDAWALDRARRSEHGQGFAWERVVATVASALG